MKKLLQIIIVLGVMALAFQYIVNMLINKHNITYSLITSDNNYLVNEIFSKTNDDNLYSFKVTDKFKNNYLFSYSKDFNKQERVITDFKSYQSNNLKCIFPIYKRNQTNTLSCKIDNEQVSYSYLKQINNQDINIIENSLLEEKYDISNWNKISTTASNDYNITVNKENIPDNYYFTSWFYKGFNLITNKETTNKELLDNDAYENKLSALVGKYYITFNTDQKDSAYSEIYIYNIKDGGKALLELEQSVSKDVYINGIYKNKLYITDPSSKRQIEISPINVTSKEVGNEEDGFKYLENNKLKIISKEEFLSSEHLFSTSNINNKIVEKYNPVSLKEYNNNYFYLTSNGDFYEVIDTKINNPILLFNLNNVKEWLVKDDAVVAISNDTVYMYTNNYGLKPIIKNKELIYNYKNIIDFVKL